MRFLFFVCFIAVAVGCTTAQTKSLTNADLTKYRQQREKAEAEYRENYAKLGFPSPEELAKRRKRSALELGEYSDRLRERNLEIERAVQAQRAASFRYSPNVFVVNEQPAYGNYEYVYPSGYYISRPRRQPYVQPGYFAGGQFWPTGPRTPPFPVRTRDRQR